MMRGGSYARKKQASAIEIPTPLTRKAQFGFAIS
jgi:hypothetical protein